MTARKPTVREVSTSDPPVGSSIVEPRWLRTDLAGQRITAVLATDGPGKDFEHAAVQKFVEATGIQVNNLGGPEAMTDRLVSYLRILGAQAPDIDVCMIDMIWPSIMHHHAVDLTDAFRARNIEVLGPIVENNTIGSKLVGIPWHADAGLLYYRTDLLAKYGYGGAPETWTELQDMATEISAGERGANPAFSGYVWPGAASEGLTCNGLEWQFSNGGGTIIEDDGTVSVNNEQVIAMFETARDWVGTISSAGVTDFNQVDARGVWRDGNAAFMRGWSGVYVASNAMDSGIRGKLDVTQLPVGEAEGARRAATLGGWQIMVSQYSKRPDAAIEFAKYLTSRELQKAYAIERSLLPTIIDLYSDVDVQAANPHFAKIVDVLNSGGVIRPSNVAADLYGEVSTVYSTTLNLILAGQVTSVPASIEGLARQLEDIMSEL
ncbi:MAG: ABC transporter substrate-binding protein [Chloroflexia bacterium]|nr:ABC transporter substrate-binding protein [Chloroflexia bacterium]